MSNKIHSNYNLCQEYIIVLRDDAVKCFCNESVLRLIALKTNCQIILTNRILNRKISNYQLIKYAIVQIRGRNESSIQRCNHLLEIRFPFYRNRQEYEKRSSYFTICQKEFISDNKRHEGTSSNLSDHQVTSPFSNNFKRPRSQTCCRLNNTDKSTKSYSKYCKDKIISESSQKQNKTDTNINLQSKKSTKKNDAFCKKYFQPPKFDTKNTSNTYRQQNTIDTKKHRSYSLQNSPKISKKQQFSVSKPFLAFSVINKLITKYETVKIHDKYEKFGTEITKSLTINSHRSENKGSLDRKLMKTKSDETLNNLESFNKIIKADSSDNLKFYQGKDKLSCTENISSSNEFLLDFSVKFGKFLRNYSQDEKPSLWFSVITTHPNDYRNKLISFNLKTTYAPENCLIDSNLQNQLNNDYNSFQQIFSTNCKIIKPFYKTYDCIKHPYLTSTPEQYLKMNPKLYKFNTNVKTDNVEVCEEVCTRIIPSNWIYSTTTSLANQFCELTNMYNKKSKIFSKIPIKISSPLNRSKTQKPIDTSKNIHNIPNMPHHANISENIKKSNKRLINPVKRSNLEPLESNYIFLTKPPKNSADIFIPEVINDTSDDSYKPLSFRTSIKKLIDISESDYNFNKTDINDECYDNISLETSDTLKDNIQTTELTKSSETSNSGNQGINDLYLDDQFIDDKTDISMSIRSDNDDDSSWNTLTEHETMKIKDQETNEVFNDFESVKTPYVTRYSSGEYYRLEYLDEDKLRKLKSGSMDILNSNDSSIVLQEEYENSENQKFNKDLHEFQSTFQNKLHQESHSVTNEVSASFPCQDRSRPKKSLKLENDANNDIKKIVNTKETISINVQQEKTLKFGFNESLGNHVSVNTTYQNPLTNTFNQQSDLQSLEHDITICIKEASITSPKLDENESENSSFIISEYSEKEIDNINRFKDSLRKLNLSIGNKEEIIHRETPYYIDPYKFTTHYSNRINERHTDENLISKTNDATREVNLSAQNLQNNVFLNSKSNFDQSLLDQVVKEEDSESESSLTLFSLHFEKVPITQPLITNSMFPLYSNCSNNLCDILDNSLSLSSISQSSYLDSLSNTSDPVTLLEGRDFSTPLIAMKWGQISEVIFNQYAYNFEVMLIKSNVILHPRHCTTRSTNYTVQYYVACIMTHCKYYPAFKQFTNIRSSSDLYIDKVCLSDFYIVHYKSSVKTTRKSPIYQYSNLSINSIDLKFQTFPIKSHLTNFSGSTSSINISLTTDTSLETVSQLQSTLTQNSNYNDNFNIFSFEN